MRNPYQRATATGQLYLQLSLILLPTFALIAGVGLYFLAEFAVEEAESTLTSRIGNTSARVAGGLERLSEVGAADHPAMQELMLVLLADPAIQCAELVPLGADKPMMEIPIGVGCVEPEYDNTLNLPIYLDDEADLIVRSSLAELKDARSHQKSIALVILIAGLVITLATNWLGFRYIIGRPLNKLMREIDTARRKAEKSALSDGLTGLANRRLLESELRRFLAETRDEGTGFAIMSLDLDQFKQINDTMGHAAGDAVLRHVAHTLQIPLTERDVLARIGGDEFVILIHGITDKGRLSNLAEWIVRDLAKPFYFQNEVCLFGASVGIDVVAPHSNLPSSERLLMNADIALYEAKEKGRGCYVYFEHELKKRVEESKQLSDELRFAMEQRELTCHYQPQFDAKTGEVIGAEALVRWMHPRLGLLAPSDFLGIATKLGVVDRIDGIVLKNSIAALRRWDESGLNIKSISVNVSPSRLEDPSLIDQLKRLDIPAGRLNIEILETTFIDELSDIAKWNLDQIRDMGIEIEIDDFGTGKASIVGVLAMAPKRLKVAREIIDPIVRSEQRQQVVQAVVALARALDVELLAEGVETEEHVSLLLGFGIRKMQGFVMSPAVPEQEFHDLATAQKTRAPHVV